MSVADVNDFMGLLLKSAVMVSMLELVVAWGTSPQLVESFIHIISYLSKTNNGDDSCPRGVCLGAIFRLKIKVDASGVKDEKETHLHNSQRR
jgi:hypothetical protein